MSDLMKKVARLALQEGMAADVQQSLATQSARIREAEENKPKTREEALAIIDAFFEQLKAPTAKK